MAALYCKFDIATCMPRNALNCQVNSVKWTVSREYATTAATGDCMDVKHIGRHFIPFRTLCRLLQLCKVVLYFLRPILMGGGGYVVYTCKVIITCSASSCQQCKRYWDGSWSQLNLECVTYFYMAYKSGSWAKFRVNGRSYIINFHKTTHEIHYIPGVT